MTNAAESGDGGPTPAIVVDSALSRRQRSVIAAVIGCVQSDHVVE